MGAVGTFARYAGQDAPRRRPALTRLRVLLIGWVLVYHLELVLHALDGLPLVEAVAMKGYLGVDGFFLLSGFALFLGYRERRPRGLAGWARFQRDRLVRVLPLHLVLLLALVLLVGAAAAAGVTINAPERFGLRELLLQAVLLHGWETTTHFAWNYPSWALSAILAGYLAFPLLLAGTLSLTRPTLWLALAIAGAGLVVLSASLPGVQLNHSLHLGLVRFGWEFVAGMTLARLVEEGALGRRVALLGLALVPVGLALDLDVVVVAGLAALVARTALARREPEPPRDLAWRLGEASFGIYLTWVFVEVGLVAVLRLADPGPAARLLLLPAGLAASLALGWLAWRLIEVPAARALAPRR